MSSKLQGWCATEKLGFSVLNPGTVLWLTVTNQDGVKYRVGPFATSMEANWYLDNPLEFTKALIATGDRSFSIVPFGDPVVEESA